MKPETLRGRTVYRCALGHAHESATVAVLCEQAPRLQVRASFELDGDLIVEGYMCMRCGGKQRSAFRGLSTLPDWTVGREVAVGEDPKVVVAWRAEAKEFHEKHTACNTEGKS